MRYSELFGKTRRDMPAAITDPARLVAYRAGLVRILEGGGTAYLPLATRVFEKMQAALNDDLNSLGAQELRTTPNCNLAALASQEIQSYKQLPVCLFWPDAGATRLQIAALAPTHDEALAAARALNALAARFYARIALEPASTYDGIWFVEHAAGELELFRCTQGDYTETRATARAFKRAAITHDTPLPLHEVETPHCDTIDLLASFLQVRTSCTAKAVFYSSEGQIIFSVVRGDLQIDENKLKRALGVKVLRFATDDEIRSIGALPGYASPIGVKGATIIVDDSIANSPNLVAGANRPGYHLLNTNIPRDYKPDLITDIAIVRAGDQCPNGDGTLDLVRARPIGAFHEPRSIDMTFLDANGKSQKVVGVELEIDLAQSLFGFISAHSDEKGIVWTRDLAPFNAHIVALRADKPDVKNALARVTDSLNQSKISYLLDDRGESAGVKFNDADLIGLPVRITVGPRSAVQNAIELKRRDEANSSLVPFDELVAHFS